jgi:hypothetical protein
MADETKYNPVTPDVAAELASIVGEKFVVFGDPEKLQASSAPTGPSRSRPC